MAFQSSILTLLGCPGCGYYPAVARGGRSTVIKCCHEGCSVHLEVTGFSVRAAVKAWNEAVVEARNKSDERLYGAYEEDRKTMIGSND